MMSPADLTSLRHLICARWPDVAESHGVEIDVFRMFENNGIARIYWSGQQSAARALHTLADVLEDEGWVVRRDGDDIYVERKATDAERDRGTAEGRARFEAILAGRDARRRAWRTKTMGAAREHGARVARMTRRSKW